MTFHPYLNRQVGLIKKKFLNLIKMTFWLDGFAINGHNQMLTRVQNMPGEAFCTPYKTWDAFGAAVISI